MRDYTKIEGSYMKIGKFIQTIYDIFDPEVMFNIKSTDDKVTTQLQKDVGRTHLISIDEDYKDFESKCFDYKHQQGGFIQGSFTGAVLSDFAFNPLKISYLQKGEEEKYKYNKLDFVYQGDDKDGFGFTASFFDSPNERILSFTFVNDFKKHDAQKSAVFVLVNDINNPELINNIKQDIQNNIKSTIVKKWLMLELFNIDGSFNEASIGNVNNFLVNNRQNHGSVRLNNSILIDRIIELRFNNFSLKESMAEMNAGSYFRMAISYFLSFFWSSDCKNSDEDSKQNVDSQISSQAITSEQVIGDTAATIVVTDILNHNQETSFEDLEKIKETIKGY